MKEFIDKLIERLEKKAFIDYDEYYTDGGECLISISDVKEIVNELAEEYKVSEMPTGWTSVSERLPEYDFTDVLITFEDGEIAIGYLVKGSWSDGYGKSDFSKVIAWMPLPAPFKEGE